MSHEMERITTTDLGRSVSRDHRRTITWRPGLSSTHGGKLKRCLYVRRRICCFAVLASVTICGCERQEQAIPERRPRPVIVTKLTRRTPPSASMISASAGSWKTEQIGFEVGGRVEFVVEPNTEIEGRVLDGEGALISPGTPVAQLESERYTLQVARAKADVTRAEQNLLAALTGLNEDIPAQIASATATRDLAKTEYERSSRLFAQKAGAQVDVDRDKANYQSAEAKLKQLAASRKSKAAEIESLKNAKLQAVQNLRDAQRNVEDCTLYASYNGQIADVSVVPGSVVSAGQPVATLQMVNPIKIEFEVSARVSRHLEGREALPVVVTMPDGSLARREGYLYLVDPVADPLTRTFTVTLLIMNENVSKLQADRSVATTSDLWRLDFKFLPGAEEGMLFVSEDALLKDDAGYYLWMVTNRTVQARQAPMDRELKVRKIRVTPGSLKVPYLGNWIFQQVVVDDKDFDPKVNMVIGKLKVSNGTAAEWNGDAVVRSSEGQWMLRPGDLVQVDLTGGEGIEGYYVPMDAITRKQGQAYIFVVDESDGKSVAKRVPINLGGETQFAATSSLRRIEPIEAGSLAGVSYIVEGAHYLIDGETVNASQLTEGDQ